MMGSNKQLLVQSLKRAALASVLGVIGGLSVNSASAQTSRYQDVQPAAFDLPTFQDTTAPPSRSFSSTRSGNSARIVGQPTFIPNASRQATVNRRALVGHGRMITAGYPQDSGTLGGLPQDREPSVLQRDEQDTPNIFDQPVPSVPRNPIPQIPVPQDPRQPQRPEGALPDDVFSNPFEGENRKKPDQGTVEIPGTALTDPPTEDPDLQFPETPDSGDNPNPFIPERSDDQINYQPGRGIGATRKRSNVYKAPGPEDAFESGTAGNEGVYFVPAYDPIPGTQKRTLAPPATIDPHNQAYPQPAWPNQYANQNHPPQYAYPGYQQQPPQYQQPPYQYQQPPYQQPPYQQPPYQYQQPPYQGPTANYAYSQNYSPGPATYADQQAYTPVVQPPTRLARNAGPQGPMTPARRPLWGKLKQEMKKDLGFGDYESCQDAGNCSGCSSGCYDNSCGVGGCGSGATCPVFYFGFQAAYNNAFDVGNGQGTEIELDSGTAYFFSLGRMNGRNLRTEIELSFRSNDIDLLRTPGGEVPLSGDLQTFSGMGNAYWEFVNSPTGRFKPYVGGGLGFLSATADIGSNSDQADSSSSFAYQWMLGINFKVSNHLDLFGEYRVTDAESFNIFSDRDDLPGNFGYTANSVGGGFRWKF